MFTDIQLFNITLVIALLFIKDKDQYKIYKGTNDSKSNSLSIFLAYSKFYY